MRYLLPCNQCDAQHEVDRTQAGETIQCSCGQVLEIPSLRGLRDLKPVASTAPPRVARRSASDLPRRLVLVAGMLLIAIGLVVGMYGGLVRTQVRVPDRASLEDPKVQAAIDDLSPVEALELWVDFRDEGLGVYQVPYRVWAGWTKEHFTRILLIGLGMVGVGILLAGGSLAWPTGRSQPLGPTEDRQEDRDRI